MDYIQRYDMDIKETLNATVFACEDGNYVKWQDVEPLLKELANLRGFANSVDQALNEGDGVYRP